MLSYQSGYEGEMGNTEGDCQAGQSSESGHLAALFIVECCHLRFINSHLVSEGDRFWYLLFKFDTSPGCSIARTCRSWRTFNKLWLLPDML
jgi:hypothetical protein